MEDKRVSLVHIGERVLVIEAGKQLEVHTKDVNDIASHLLGVGLIPKVFTNAKVALDYQEAKYGLKSRGYTSLEAYLKKFNML